MKEQGAHKGWRKETFPQALLSALTGKMKRRKQQKGQRLLHSSEWGPGLGTLRTCGAHRGKPLPSWKAVSQVLASSLAVAERISIGMLNSRLWMWRTLEFGKPPYMEAGATCQVKLRREAQTRGRSPALNGLPT